MAKVRVNLKNKGYDILIKENLLSTCGSYIKHLNTGKKILIVTQDKVPKKYIQKAKNSLARSGFKIFLIVLPSGEHFKNLDSLLKILNVAIKNKFERNDSFCAIGGGVITDLAGFATSIYYRGVNFLCIPTTLLGMVDAAIGGKTGINIKEGKNLLGTFYQPKIVLIDPGCIKTLPKREFLTGMGEVIKYALLEKTAKKSHSKSGFFKYLKSNKHEILKTKTNKLINIITHSAKVKAKIVESDEKESGLRAILNLGHTFAHGIEQAYDYKKYTHGEAVSIGSCLAARLSLKHNYVAKKDVDSIVNLFASFGLPTKLENANKVNKIIESMTHDKKVKNGRLRFILPYKSIGNVKIISGINKNELKSLLKNNK